MSKSKDLRKLVDKIKDDISIQIERIVEWNLDESKIVHRLYRQSKNNDEEFNFVHSIFIYLLIYFHLYYPILIVFSL